MFKMSENPIELITALLKAQAKFGDITKDKPGYNYKYATLDSILKAVKPALQENDIFLTQPVTTSDNGDIVVSTMLVHKTGQFMGSEFHIKPVPMQKETQVTPQAVGSAISYARRYGIQSALGLTAEDDDGSSASGQTNGNANGYNEYQNARRQVNTTQPAPTNGGQQVQVVANIDEVNKLREERSRLKQQQLNSLGG